MRLKARIVNAGRQLGIGRCRCQNEPPADIVAFLGEPEPVCEPCLRCGRLGCIVIVKRIAGESWEELSPPAQNCVSSHAATALDCAERSCAKLAQRPIDYW